MRERQFIREIENEFQSYYETTISEMKEGHPQFGRMTNTAIVNIQDDLVAAEIKRRNAYFNRETLSDYQNAEYHKALVQQIFYVLTEGDFHMMSGFDVTTNSYAQKKDLKERYLAPAAEETLTAAGLFYSALNGGFDGRFCRHRKI